MKKKNVKKMKMKEIIIIMIMIMIIELIPKTQRVKIEVICKINLLMKDLILFLLKIKIKI
jgi:hypothetical protein